MTATSRRRRILVPLATLTAATGIAIASGATFSTSTASTGLVASGTLKQTNSNSVAFSKSNLKPGDTVSGTVTITNSGTLPSTYSLAETELENTFATQSLLSLSVTDSAGNVVSSGELGATAPVVLGTFAVNESRTYTFKVTFSQDAPNAEQGKTARTSYAFTSVQTAAENFTATQGGTAVTNP